MTAALKRRGTTALFRRGGFFRPSPMEKFMAKGTKIGRDARDRRFIPVDVAIRRPPTTTVETIKKSK